MEEKKTFAEAIKENACEWVLDHHDIFVYGPIMAAGMIASAGIGYFSGRWDESLNQSRTAWFELGKIAGHEEVMDAIADGSIEEVEKT